MLHEMTLHFERPDHEGTCDEVGTFRAELQMGRWAQIAADAVSAGNVTWKGNSRSQTARQALLRPGDHRVLVQSPTMTTTLGVITISEPPPVPKLVYTGRKA